MEWVIHYKILKLLGGFDDEWFEEWFPEKMIYSSDIKPSYDQAVTIVKKKLKDKMADFEILQICKRLTDIENK